MAELSRHFGGAPPGTGALIRERRGAAGSAARRAAASPALDTVDKMKFAARHPRLFETPSMTLLYIVLATLVGGLLSVLIAASLTVGLLARVVRNLVSLSAGVLLATALLNVLPEAFESQASPHSLFATLLARAAVLLPAREGRAVPPYPPPRGRRAPPRSSLRRAAGRAGRLERARRRQHPQLLRRHHHRRRLPRPTCSSAS